MDIYYKNKINNKRNNIQELIFKNKNNFRIIIN